jgi:serine/threonine protein kinase
MKDALIGDRYRLLDPLGSGGEARVFRAHDASKGAEVALRLGLQPATFTLARELPPFHPGWVRLLDSGVEPGHGAYQVYELIEGQTLDAVISKIGPMDANAWHRFVAQSLDAVEALHHAGWIHGDLNADNFLRIDSAPNSWKLLELPFLRFDAPADRSPLFGSIHTLAPEQIDGAPADARSDLYALGCLYYYAAAGIWPHSGVNPQDIAIGRLRFAPAPLHENAPYLSALCSEVVMKLLERSPVNRVSSVSAARHLLGVA